MSITPETLTRFRRRVEAEWRDNIAPFWLRWAPDPRYGGFHGLITNDLQVDERAEKGIILNSRILWTFSRAFRLYQESDFRGTAERAYEYLNAHFFDRDFGGVFWTVDYQGRPLDTRKRPYAQAFALYALNEFYGATGERSALDQALSLFDLIERQCRDREHDGYLETFERDWTLARDQRLSEVDQDEKKSMNAHLHVLEAYAALAVATQDELVKERLRSIIELFLTRILDQRTFHFRMFFDEAWQPKSDHISFGHDIEGSWLLGEAAEALSDNDVLARVSGAALRMAEAVFTEALNPDGSLVYEADANGVVSDNRDWWVQTEAVVGFLNAYRLSGNEKFLGAALRAWQFIDDHLIDRNHGEWYWRVSRAGQPIAALPKLSQWKCPYHNGRMCFEVSRRLSAGNGEG